MKSISETLGELGIDGTSTSTSGSAGSTASTSGPSSTEQSASPALREFLHAFFQSLQGQSASAETSSGNTGAVTGATSAGYKTFGTKLQSLLQNLGNGTDPTGKIATLSKDFQQLVTASEQTGTTPTGATPPTLQSFLQTLIQNLGAQQDATASTAAVGGLLNLAA